MNVRACSLLCPLPSKRKETPVSIEFSEVDAKRDQEGTNLAGRPLKRDDDASSVARRGFFDGNVSLGDHLVGSRQVLSLVERVSGVGADDGRAARELRCRVAVSRWARRKRIFVTMGQI